MGGFQSEQERLYHLRTAVRQSRRGLQPAALCPHQRQQRLRTLGQGRKFYFKYGRHTRRCRPGRNRHRQMDGTRLVRPQLGDLRQRSRRTHGISHPYQFRRPDAFGDQDFGRNHRGTEGAHPVCRQRHPHGERQVHGSARGRGLRNLYETDCRRTDYHRRPQPPFQTGREEQAGTRQGQRSDDCRNCRTRRHLLALRELLQHDL